MDAGPFPVDKRAAQALALAEAEYEPGFDSQPFAVKDSVKNDLTAVARAGAVTARRIRPHSALKSVSLRNQEEPAADDDGVNPPERNYDCPNYETCLGLAAALDWKSFTCKGCCGTVNQQLLWRAHHRIRNNPSLSRLCNLPVLTS